MYVIIQAKVWEKNMSMIGWCWPSWFSFTNFTYFEGVGAQLEWCNSAVSIKKREATRTTNFVREKNIFMNTAALFTETWSTYENKPSMAPDWFKLYGFIYSYKFGLRYWVLVIQDTRQVAFTKCVSLSTNWSFTSDERSLNCMSR